jgi:hypothetical protein
VGILRSLSNLSSLQPLVGEGVGGEGLSQNKNAAEDFLASSAALPRCTHSEAGQGGLVCLHVPGEVMIRGISIMTLTKGHSHRAAKVLSKCNLQLRKA